MKLNLAKPFLGLDSQPLSTAADTPMGKLLANALAQSSTGPAIKFFDWALNLHAGKTIEIDDADKATLISFVETNPNMNNLVKSQLLRELAKLSQEAIPAP
jgi:hypothetical protein